MRCHDNLPGPPAARVSSCAFLGGEEGEGAEVHLEDGCFRVAVDGHNHLAVLHTRNVLDGTTDANSNVQLRGNNLACLANLQGRQNSTRLSISAFIDGC